MALTADEQAAASAGFVMPQGTDNPRAGDDAIRANAVAATKLIDKNRALIPTNYIPAVRSKNLLDPDVASSNVILFLGGTTPGTTTPYAGYTVSDWVSVTPGVSYTGKFRNLAWYTSERKYISAVSNSAYQVTTTTSPVNAAWARVSLPTDNATDAMLVAAGTYPDGYVTPKWAAPTLRVPEHGPVEVIRSGAKLQITTQLGSMRLTIPATLADATRNGTYNPYAALISGVAVHGFTPGDDMAPIRTQLGTIGGNHGYACVTQVNNPDGKDTTDVGAVYASAGTEYTILAVNATRVTLGAAFTKDARGVVTAPIPNLSADLTHVTGGTHTAPMSAASKSAPGAAQLYPSSTRARVQVWCDGRAVNADGTYRGNEVRVTETYDVMAYDDLITKARTNVGTPFTALDIAGCVRVSHTLIYRPEGRCDVHVEMIELRPTDLGVCGIVQSVVPSMPGANVTRYVPGVRPIGGYDWSKGVDLTNYAANIIVTRADLSDPSQAPPYSFDLVRDATGEIQFGYVMGYPPFAGHTTDNGPRLTAAATNLWDLRSTKKSYPTALTSARAGWSRLTFRAFRHYLSPADASTLRAALTTTTADALSAWAALPTPRY